MTVLALILLAVAALAPLALVLLRRNAPLRGDRDTALALHRAQLAELDRDLAEGRIDAGEHATAILEVQRRLLASADLKVAPVADQAGRASGALVALLAVVPAVAVALYLIAGRPELPDAPLAARIAAGNAESQEAAALVATLRQRLALLDPKSDMARQGYVLLGNVEAGRGNLPQAVQAWQTALAARFDPDTAARAAEAQTIIDGKVSPASAALFRRALAEAPPDAPWRDLVRKRLEAP